MRQALFLVTGLLVLLPLPGIAETLYVTDKINIAMRAAPGKEAALLKMLASGAALEVLVKEGNQMRVRDPEKIEGWVDAGYLVPELPARVQVEKMQAQLQQAQIALTQETAKTKELTDKLAQLPGNTPAEPMQIPKQAGNPSAAENYLNVGWLIFSFAMLIVGFFAGIQWIRRAYRRRMGGMYLRI
jgi:SH3 domain protein